MPWKIFMVEQDLVHFAAFKVNGVKRQCLGIKPPEWFEKNPDAFDYREPTFAHEGLAVPASALPVGAAYFSEWDIVSGNYLEIKHQRLPLVVKLPSHLLKGGEWFCVDRPVRGEPHGGRGWVVVGTPPDITLSPSINCEGRYHGWIKNGVITDDCEGRTYPQFPNTA